MYSSKKWEYYITFLKAVLSTFYLIAVLLDKYVYLEIWIT